MRRPFLILLLKGMEKGWDFYSYHWLSFHISCQLLRTYKRNVIKIWRSLYGCNKSFRLLLHDGGGLTLTQQNFLFIVKRKKKWSFPKQSPNRLCIHVFIICDTLKNKILLINIFQSSTKVVLLKVKTFA